MALEGQVCVVTGGSRGVGAGIAFGLAEAGATVYATGRNGAALDALAARFRRECGGAGRHSAAAAGSLVGIQTDHGDDASVRAMFATVARAHGGRLDVLVNNAFGGAGALMRDFLDTGAAFYEAREDACDAFWRVGLRSAYVAGALAARTMVAQRRRGGLIVTVSSGAGLAYALNAAYGVGKAAADRLACDMGVELRARGTGVASVGLWPGVVAGTDAAAHALASPDGASAALDRVKIGAVESARFTGRVVAALAADAATGAVYAGGKNASILNTAELAAEYGVRELGGKPPPPSMRSLSFLLGAGVAAACGPSSPWVARARACAPRWLLVPWWLVAAATQRRHGTCVLPGGGAARRVLARVLPWTAALVLAWWLLGLQRRLKRAVAVLAVSVLRRLGVW